MIPVAFSLRSDYSAGLSKPRKAMSASSTIRVLVIFDPSAFIVKKRWSSSSATHFDSRVEKSTFASGRFANVEKSMAWLDIVSLLCSTLVRCCTDGKRGAVDVTLPDTAKAPGRFQRPGAFAVDWRLVITVVLLILVF